MIEIIKKVRVQIDGLAQLTKNLNPFEWIVKEVINDTTPPIADDIPNNPIEYTGMESGIVQHRNNMSFGPDGTGSYRYHGFIRTDRGVFRIGSNMQPINEDDFTFNRNSIEIDRAVQSLLMAKAWFGKLLGAQAAPTPYQNDGKRKEVSDIEPTADTWVEAAGLTGDKDGNPLDALQLGTTIIVFYEWVKKSHIEKVDFLRQEIQSVIKEWQGEMSPLDPPILHQALVHLIEARFHLGFELERIRNSK